MKSLTKPLLLTAVLTLAFLSLHLGWWGPVTEEVLLQQLFQQHWALAWPVFIGQLSVLAFSTVDTLLGARHSAADLAALAVVRVDRAVAPAAVPVRWPRWTPMI